MAMLNDSAGIFTGDCLDLFNRIQIVVARDGDVAYAQAVLVPALTTVVATTQNASGAVTDRAPD